MLDTFDQVTPWVVAGLAVTSFAVTTLQPHAGAAHELLTSSLPAAVVSPVLRTLLFTAVLPLQMCEHATVAVAKGLATSHVVTPGTAFAFLILAPATNLATLGALVSGSPDAAAAVARVAATFVLVSVALSFFLDACTGGAGDDALAAVAGGAQVLPAWFEHASVWCAGGLLAMSVGRRLGLDLFPKGSSVVEGCDGGGKQKCS